MKINRLPLYLVLAMVVAVGAANGLHADSVDEARFGQEDMPDYDGESWAMNEFSEGVVALALEYTSAVSVWSYRHPVIAGSVLLYLPWIVISAVTIRMGTLGALTAYVAYKEIRQRKGELSDLEVVGDA